MHTGNQRQEPVPLGNVVRDRMSDNKGEHPGLRKKTDTPSRSRISAWDI